MIDLFTAEFGSLRNDERYSAIGAFAEAQPQESNRHDFKLIWTNEAIKDVAAFANTFGGLLIVGVGKNQTDAKAQLTGVESNSELTTGIASAIATNISPTPSYEPMECYKPGEPNRRFCVVRIRSDSRLYLVTKKDISSPVWIRDADQTVRADATQLRGMIDREKHPLGNEPVIFLRGRAERLFEEMPIGESYPNWPTGSWYGSGTYFKLALIPTEWKTVSLSWMDEDRFLRRIHTHYLRVHRTVAGDPCAANQAENRSADYYEYRWQHKSLDYESRWRISNNLEVAHATQIKDDDQWSLMDVVSYTILLLKVGAECWRALNYFGDGVLFAELAVKELRPRRGSNGEFQGLFNPGGGEFAMRPDVVTVHTQQREITKASVGVNFSTTRGKLPRTVTLLMNGLLRSLGHSVLQYEFEKDIRDIMS